jgi:hypothetical protein
MTTKKKERIPANEGHPTERRGLLTGPVIVTRYLGPTNRIKATHKRDSEATWQATVAWDHSLSAEANHQTAAEQLLDRWITRDDLVIIGRGHDHDAYYWLVVGLWQLEA